MSHGFCRVLAFAIILAAVQFSKADDLRENFTYQGRLFDNGAPVNGNYDIRFRLYDVLTNGTALASTCANNNTISDGYFTVIVNQSLLQGNLTGSKLWLEIEIKPDPTSILNCAAGAFTVLAPRQELTIAPQSGYAMRTPWSGISGVPAGFADGIDNTGALTLPFSGNVSAAQSAFTVNNTFTGTGDPVAVHGIIDPSEFTLNNVTPAAVLGENLDTAGLAIGVAGKSASGIGVLGVCDTDVGVQGSSTTGNGVAGQSSTGLGVRGLSNSGGGVQGTSSSGSGIEGISSTGSAGHFSISNAANAGDALKVLTNGNTASQAVRATHSGLGDCGLFEITNASNEGEALEARTNGSGDAVQAINTGTSGGRAGFFEQIYPGTTAVEIRGTEALSGGSQAPLKVSSSDGQSFILIDNDEIDANPDADLFLNCGSSNGDVYIAGAGGDVRMANGGGNVLIADDASRLGVGIGSPLAKVHVTVEAGTGLQVDGGSDSNAIHAQAFASGGDHPRAVYAVSDAIGVFGHISGAIGGFQQSAVVGYAESGNSSAYGVHGISNSSDGVGVKGAATGPGAFAVYAFGDFGGNGGKYFEIDHPLDPANKYLRHFCAEGPDPLNIYNGTVVLDQSGTASVALPEYFEALNRDFTYQLTCVGGHAPVYVAEEVANNRFRIAGGTPGLKVSWTVTGIRNDPYMQHRRKPVEQDKPVELRGKYLFPELYGASPDLAIERPIRSIDKSNSESTHTRRH